MTFTKKQVNFSDDKTSPAADAGVITRCLLRGLADQPAGPERTEAFGVRRSEVLEGIEQVEQILTDTEREMVQEQRNVSASSLIQDRINIAFSMILGLEEGIAALEWMEMSDASCEADHAGWRGPTTWAPTMHSTSSSAAKSIEIAEQLGECKKKAMELSDKFAATSSASLSDELASDADLAALPKAPKPNSILRCDSKAEVAASLAYRDTILDKIAVNLVVGLSNLAYVTTERFSPISKSVFFWSETRAPMKSGRSMREDRISMSAQASELEAWFARVSLGLYA
eukprot:CAMPEP_0180490890 /NCGR_PEP_ID=MMETSP1036_2-20121128/39358_1 /TAXON_ID=632150 /ORGANISM="Azadinium spinosum, Strain 3D9" /LENGTH=284 /DNA_ID=CAMNT_0022499117 /DNA_START=19 /DNA_END=873 /DNA_ORIENTATION=+